MMPAEDPTHTAPHPNQRRSACERCRRQKLRCSRQNSPGQPRCQRCARLGFECLEGRQRRIGRPSRRETSTSAVGISGDNVDPSTSSSEVNNATNNGTAPKSPVTTGLEQAFGSNDSCGTQHSQTQNIALKASLTDAFNFSNTAISLNSHPCQTTAATNTAPVGVASVLGTTATGLGNVVNGGSRSNNVDVQSEAFENACIAALSSDGGAFDLQTGMNSLAPETGTATHHLGSGNGGGFGGAGQEMAVDPSLEASLLDFESYTEFMSWPTLESSQEQQQQQQQQQQQHHKSRKQQNIEQLCQQQHNQAYYFQNQLFNASPYHNAPDMRAPLPRCNGTQYMADKVKSLIPFAPPPPISIPVRYSDSEILIKMSGVNQNLSECLGLLQKHQRDVDIEELVSIQSPLAASGLNMIERGIMAIQDFLHNLVCLQQVLYGGFDMDRISFTFLDGNIGKMPPTSTRLTPLLARSQYAVFEATSARTFPDGSSSVGSSPTDSGCDLGNGSGNGPKKVLGTAMSLTIISCYSQAIMFLEILLYHINYALENMGDRPLYAVPGLKFGAVPLSDAAVQGKVFTQLVGHLLDRVDQLVGVPLSDPSMTQTSTGEGLLSRMQLKMLWLELGSTHSDWSPRSQVLREVLIQIKRNLNSMALM